MKIRLPQFRAVALSLTVMAVSIAGSRGDFAITEIMAVADLNYPDEDGQPSDWIEITNGGPAADSLAGHYLTNAADDLTRWAFPAVSVPAGQSIVVFASGKNRAVAGSELHTSFTLDRGGDYLALIAPDGMTPVSELAPMYPEQYDGISYGIGTSGGVSQATFVDRGATVRYHIPTDDSLGTAWREPAPTFDDSTWSSAPGAVGFESNAPPSGLWALITTSIQDDMKAINASGYFRYPFTFDASVSAVTGLRLKVWCDDGFVVYLNGVELESDRMPASPTWNSAATGSRGDSTVINDGPLDYDFSGFAGAVVDGDNVLAVQAANRSSNGSDFLIDVELTAEVADTSGGLKLGYFEIPTPGAPNETNKTAPPGEVAFSEPSQLFTDEVTVALSCETPGAIIRYSTDLSEPSIELGGTSVTYTGPVALTSSTQIRARSFLPAALPGPVGVETYLRIEPDVEAFSSDLPVVVLSTLGTGAPFPSSSTDRRHAFIFFFEPDPATGRTTLTGEPQIVTRGGIRKRGSSSAGWPKYGMSLETWENIGIDRDGDGDISNDEEIDNNIEPFGFDREADWILNSRYEFDKALMRNPLIYDLSRQVGQYAARTKFIEIYNDVDGGTVDANDYFGVYTFMEKIEADPNRVDVERLMPWENSEPEVTGGYIFKRDRNDAGSPPTYNVSGAGGALIPHDPGGREVSPAQKSYIEGYLSEMNTAIINRPSGINPTTGKHWAEYLDIDTWIDHHWLNTLAMNVDWGRLSAYYHKDRGGRVIAGPIWDFDRNMGSSDGRDNNPRVWDGSGDSSQTWFDSRYPWFGNLIGPTADPAAAHYPDVRQQHTDRWFDMREGPLTNANIVATIDRMADELREAQARSFARWPSLPRGNPGNFNGPSFAEAGTTGWEAEVSHIKGWMTARADWIDEQYLASPQYSHPGGVVADGFELAITSPVGAIYYTLDGSDPRASGGAPSASAIPLAGGAVDSVFLGEGTPFTYFVPSDDSLGSTWIANGFDDGQWATGTGGAGWENEGGLLEPFVETDVSGSMKGINATGYFRYEFEFNNAANVNSMSLEMLIDDGYVAYLNGVEVASLLAPATPLFNSGATGSRNDQVVVVGLTVDISAFSNALVDGTNVLAIQAMGLGNNGSDFLVRPELTINNSVTGESVVLSGAVVVTARVLEGGGWSAPTQVGYLAGATPADATNLVVSEFNYHPASPTAGEIAEGYTDQDQFEYIELLNVSDSTLALVGVSFSAGLDFDFDGGSISGLLPGERALVVRDLDAFTFRYGAAAAARVAGTFAGGTGLSNGGEQIALAGVGGVIRDFEYDDDDPWPTGADGDGYSLELIAPGTLPDHSMAGSWRSSAMIGGTPGSAGGEAFATWSAANGGVAAGDDGDADGRNALLEFAQGGDPTVPEAGADFLSTRVESFEVDGVEKEYLTLRIRTSLSANGIKIEPELSSDLENWADAGADVVLVEEDNLGDGTAKVKYRTALPLAELPNTELFLRAKVTEL